MKALVPRSAAGKAAAAADSIPDSEAGKLWLRLLMPRLAGNWLWVETVVLTLATLLVCRLASPSDPFLVQAQFPWPWIAPVLIALRYGVLPGTVSSGLLLSCWYLLAPGGFAAELPKLYFLGGQLLVMVCGEYSGIWRTRLRRMIERGLYLEDRVERVTKRLHLLRLSHDRLEQDLLTRPTTLRDALAELRRRTEEKALDDRLGGAQVMLEFLAQHCQVEVAAIYESQAGSGLPSRRVAAIGEPPPLRAGDPLFEFARERQRLAHVQTAGIGRSLPTDHLLVAPIVSSEKHLLGYLVVTRLPFFALNDDTLQTMAVLLSAYADDVSSATAVLPILSAYPGCPIDFAEELVKLGRIQRDFGLASNIVALVFGDHPERVDMFQQVARAKRGPDVMWAIESLLDRSYIFNLMPLSGTAAVEGYLFRIESMLREGFGDDLTALKVAAHTIPLSDPDPLAVARRLMQRERHRDA